MEYSNAIVLQTKGLTKVYKGVKAVDDVSIAINRGEIYGLVGLNGAGKTTFMRIILGLAEQNEGSFEIFGAKTAKERAIAGKRIGAVIENPALFPGMTAKDNLLQQAILEGSAGEEEVADVLELVGLEDTGKKKVKSFSLGMKQRLSIALAMLGNPEFLVLDEPTNALDPLGMKEVRELLLKISSERGVTILISSHLLSELFKVATRFGVIHKGKLIKELSADDVEREVEGGKDPEDIFIDLMGGTKHE